MKEIIWELKRKKILTRMVLPFLAYIIVAIALIIFNNTLKQSLIVLDFVGIFIATVGAVFALRPILRILINPNIKKREILERDKSAGLVSFVWIMNGFVFQMINRLALLTDIKNKIHLSIGIISVMVISIYLTYNTLKKFRNRKIKNDDRN